MCCVWTHTIDADYNASLIIKKLFDDGQSAVAHEQKTSLLSFTNLG